jgi:hypothetical protein
MQHTAYQPDCHCLCRSCHRQLCQSFSHRHCQCSAVQLSGCTWTQVWTVVATDNCGNSSSCQVPFSWTIDTEGPVFTACPTATQVVPCNTPPTSQTAIAYAGLVTDNCANPSLTATANAAPFNLSGCTWTQVWTVVATDNCGNSSSCQVPVQLDHRYRRSGVHRLSYSYSGSTMQHTAYQPDCHCLCRSCHRQLCQSFSHRHCQCSAVQPSQDVPGLRLDCGSYG